jgi:hypothetical protein
VDAAFVCRMEDVLDLYAAPPDPARPLVCFDEKSYQLLSEVRAPQPCAPTRPRREDSEYQREGTCNLFLTFAPHLGWRHVEVTEHRTAIDVAHQFRALADVHFREANAIQVVLDNLNVHTLAVLYLAFPPAEARRIARKLELHYTPNHGSWLNMDEIELSVLERQCLAQRLATRERVAAAVAPWEAARNAAHATVTWRFTTDTARMKLGRLYPRLES